MRREKETGDDNQFWIHFAPDIEKWRAFMNTVMIISLKKKRGYSCPDERPTASDQTRYLTAICDPMV
jgi:hypothetical protein